MAKLQSKQTIFDQSHRPSTHLVEGRLITARADASDPVPDRARDGPLLERAVLPAPNTHARPISSRRCVTGLAERREGYVGIKVSHDLEA
jgi:hypothetical protein